jgi:hypothetical protein
MPDDAQRVTLEAISVSGGMLAVSVTLDRRLGYQIQVDMATGEVLNIRAHDPPPPPAPPGPAAVAVAALKSAPTPWVAMIGLGALTLLIVIVMVMRIGVRAWRRGARTERRRIAAPNRSHTRVG